MHGRRISQLAPRPAARARLGAWLLCVLGWPALGATPLGPAQPDAVLTSSIAPQPLSLALSDFVRQTSLQLVYVSSLAAGRRSAGAAAGLPLPEALGRLLAGTGLRFEYLNQRTVRLYAAPAVTPGNAARASDWHAPGATEEILVTANKRVEPLGLVPMSASVLGAADLEAQGVKAVADIAAVTPGAEYDISSQFGPGILTSFAIRGINGGKGDPTTGIYIDDTPIQAPYTSLSNTYPVTFDLARVEVLRGPQGVLFGRGAEGGALRFITREPSLTTTDVLLHSEVDSTAHGGVSLETGAAVGGPLIDGVLGARASGWYRDEDGFVNRVDPFSGATLDARANRHWTEAFRLGLAYAPTDQLTITPTLSYQASHVHDTPVFYTYLSAPDSGSLQNGKLLRQPAVDRFTLGALRIEEHLGPATLTAVSSFYDRRASATVDETNEAGVYLGGYGNPLGPEFPNSYADADAELLDVHQILLAQELRLASADEHASLSWMAGLFYSRLRQDFQQNNFLAAAPAVPAISADDYLTQTELSAFGQAELAIATHWKLGAGMRIGWSRSTGSALSGGYLNGGGTQFAAGARSASLPLMPRYTVSYRPDASSFYYASAARGFRGGGSNGDAPAQCGSNVVPQFYGPDSVWSLELGAKNRLFGEHLQLDASVYDVRWSEVQELFYDPCGNGFSTNDGAIASSGFDLSAAADLSHRLRLKVAMGFNNTHFTKTVTIASGQLIALRGASGGVPAIPAPWTGTVALEYRWPVAPVTTAYLSAEDVVHSHDPGPFTEQDPRWIVYDPRISADPALNLVNLRCGLERAGLSLEVFVRNALNQQPTLQLYADAPGSALLYGYTLRPRTLGVGVTWRH